MLKKNKKGVSPVIATVLLIAMVVVIALIVFAWFRSFTGETITKFGGQNIELVCDDVDFTATYSQASGLFINNIGNVPIIGMKIKKEGKGSFDTEDLPGVSGKLKLSGTHVVPNLNLGADITSITLIPVLRGNSDSGPQDFICDEKRHGLEIEI